MSQSTLLIILLVAPVLVLTFLRINAVLVFLSLCLGEVLVRFVAGEANTMISLFFPKASTLGLSMIQIIVLLLPAILTSVFMIFSVKGKGKFLFNIFPAAGVGLLVALLVVPLLPPSAQATIEDMPLWGQLAKMQALIVGVSALLSLGFLWLQRRRSSEVREGGRH